LLTPIQADSGAPAVFGDAVRSIKDWCRSFGDADCEGVADTDSAWFLKYKDLKTGPDLNNFQFQAEQHYLYLVRQMRDIRGGKRRNANPEMLDVSKPYADDDIQVVVDYMSRLPSVRN
jgi:hypothetical protein